MIPSREKLALVKSGLFLAGSVACSLLFDESGRLPSLMFLAGACWWMGYGDGCYATRHDANLARPTAPKEPGDA